MDLAVSISRVVDRLPRGRIGAHVADQLVRRCTAPVANYAEALGGEPNVQECDELIAIFVASIRTAKKNIE